MILDMLLNESANKAGTSSSYVPVELDAPHYTPDMDGMSEIVLESQERLIQLDEAIMLCEQISLAESIKGNGDKAAQLQKGAAKDYFIKIVNLLRDMWNKVTTFFKNLYKNIEVGVKDIIKVLDTHKDDLKKDFSNYSYTGHKWKKLNAQQYANNAKGRIKSIDTDQKKLISKMNTNSTKDEMSSDEINKVYDDLKNVKDTNFFKADNIRNYIVHGNDSKALTLDEAKLDIAESYRTKTAESIKSFSDCSIDNMVSFIKNFKNNEILITLRKNTDDLFKTSIASADATRSAVERIRDTGNTGSSMYNHGAAYVAAAKRFTATLTTTMNIFDSVMAICISLEKERFNEYKKAVIGAMRYNPKDDK